MKVFVGETRDQAYIARMKMLGWGRMWTVAKVALYPGEDWAFDNGAYAWFTQGVDFKEDVFKRRVDALVDRQLPAPYLAVLPDIVGGGVRSLDFSMSWLDRLPTDWPWYLAVQDGCSTGDVDTLCELLPNDEASGINERISGLFLGGTDKFKCTSIQWAELAHKHGLPFHYGRAGTLKKVRAARISKADSLDSSFPLWERGRFKAFERFLTEDDPQGELFPPDAFVARFDGERHHRDCIRLRIHDEPCLCPLILGMNVDTSDLLMDDGG